MSSKNTDEGGSRKITDEGHSKRRRGLGVVTPNACTECRKKRVKCNGQVPCSRCSSQRGVDCVYEVPMRKSKEDMRSEIESLRAQQRQNERLMAALVSTDQSEHIISQLRTGATIEGIVEQLEAGGSMTSPGGSHNSTTFSRETDQRAIAHASQPGEATIDGGNAFRSGFASRDMAVLDDQYLSHPGGGRWHGSTAISHGLPNDSHSPRKDPMVWHPDDTSVRQHGFPLLGTWLRAVEDHSPTGSSTLHSRSHGQNTILALPDELPIPHGEDTEMMTPNWTRVTEDTAFVDHLMALYFCWEYPTFASLNKEHFMADYKSGSRRHCSPLLVNAILALGCRFSNQPQARADPANSSTAGDHFFAEARILLEQIADKHSLIVVQALGIMSIREASCGRSSESLFLAGQSIRLAIEMGLNHDSEKNHKGRQENNEEEKAENAVRAATFWGAFSLDQAWSLSIGRLPQFSRDLKLVTKPAIIAHVESSQWVPYTDDGGKPPVKSCWYLLTNFEAGAPLHPSCIQRSNVRTVYRTFCELSEIVHQTLYTLYTPGMALTGKTLSARYTQYLDFHASLPQVVKLGENFTPSVIFTNMYFHYAMLLLFRPFIKLRVLGVGQILPRDICAQAAEAVSELVKAYAGLYTLRRTPSFVPYFVLTSTITHVITLSTGRSDEKGEELCQQGFDSLKEMANAHGFAVEAMRILEYLVQHWKIPISFNNGPGKTEDHRLLCRPQPISMNEFCPNIENEDMTNNIGKVAWNGNPLFWPFPLQGRPLLNVGPELESLGFSVLTEYREEDFSEMQVEERAKGTTG